MSRSPSCIRKGFVLTVSAICQKKNDNAVGRRTGPQWTRCRRGPSFFAPPHRRSPASFRPSTRPAILPTQSVRQLPPGRFLLAGSATSRRIADTSQKSRCRALFQPGPGWSRCTSCIGRRSHRPGIGVGSTHEQYMANKWRSLHRLMAAALGVPPSVCTPAECRWMYQKRGGSWRVIGVDFKCQIRCFN